MTKQKLFYVGILAAVLGLFTYGVTAFTKKNVPITASLTGFDGDGRVIHSFDLTGKEFSFAGERYPVENFDVMERLDREILINAYLQSTTIQNIKLAARYFPVIEPIMAEEGLPDDFKYLCVAESTLRNLTSVAGAKGLWQFMKPTALQYGLEVNEEIDERYHTEKATRAACRLLKDNNKRFGSWLLASAAYNEGALRLGREITEQRANTYFDLNLNEETSRYVFRIMAIKEIMQHPEAYDFQVPSEHLYSIFPETYEVTVNGATNWADFAQSKGISYRTLKVFNPWILTPQCSNKLKKTYTVKVPK